MVVLTFHGYSDRHCFLDHIIMLNAGIPRHYRIVHGTTGHGWHMLPSMWCCYVRVDKEINACSSYNCTTRFQEKHFMLW